MKTFVIIVFQFEIKLLPDFCTSQIGKKSSVLFEAFLQPSAKRIRPYMRMHYPPLTPLYGCRK